MKLGVISKRGVTPLLATAVGTLFLQPADIGATVAVCPGATTLEELTACLVDSNHMPRSGSNGFSVPSPGEQLDWDEVVKELLDGTQSGACASVALPSGFSGLYEITAFTDASNGDTYCVLAEIAENGDPDKKAWGTFVTSLEPRRELAIQISHPLNDLDTALQGVSVFKTTRARSFLLTGSHRNANDAISACQSSYGESDAAHNVENMFHTTTEAMLEWYQTQQLHEELVVIQFHGMGASTCPGVDVYMTYGRSPGNGTPAAGEDILTLQAELEAQHPDWAVVVPGGTPSCTLNATTNTQGRFLNGVALQSVCGTAASGYSGRFIHIEQKRDFRTPEDWFDSIEATWPVGCSVDEHFEAGPAGWLNSIASTCSAGAFVTATPTEQSSAGGVLTQVAGDHTSGVGRALFTATNTSNGNEDVDGGVCIVESPVYPVSVDSEVSIWYFHGQSETADDPSGDFFLLEISTDSGTSYSSLKSIGDVATNAVWRETTTRVAAGSSVKFRLQVSDGTADGSLVEGGGRRPADLCFGGGARAAVGTLRLGRPGVWARPFRCAGAPRWSVPCSVTGRGRLRTSVTVSTSTRNIPPDSESSWQNSAGDRPFAHRGRFHLGVR